MNHLHDTRQKSDLFITGHITKLVEQSTTYSDIHIYNRLAKEIENTETLTKFKKKLADFLIEECLYSVEEFLNYRTGLYRTFFTYVSVNIMFTLLGMISPHNQLR
jgi:hypothetical protein